MEILRRFLLIVAFIFVLICCINDATQQSCEVLIDCLLAGGLVALLFPNKKPIILKLSFSFCAIATIIFCSTSIKSFILFIPAFVTAFAFCVQLLVAFCKTKKYVLYLIASLSVFCASRSFWIHHVYSQFSPNKIAVIEHGKWGNALNYDNSLSITSQYSYDFLHNFIGGTKIEDLKEIDNYTELWLVTPTKPFNLKEIEIISNWVRKGGRLVIITDHTDLFGHATAINPLLSRFGISVQKDVILDSTGDGGTFRTFFEKFSGLSANSIKGTGETWLYQLGYSERTDYSKRSFFSDNQISDEEIADCFCVGIRTKHGLGGLIVFGDSTLLANFALARPSAQAILNKLIRGGGSFSCYGFAFFSCIAYLFTFLNLSSQYKIGAVCSIIMIGLVCVCIAHEDRKLCLAKVQTIKVNGDWTLVEGEQGHLLTLFSASYISSSKFPIWNGISKDSRTVNIGDTEISETDFCAPYSLNNVSLSKLLTMSSKGDITTLLSEYIKTSGYSSFWFDDGVGLLREHAYKLFWNRFSDSSKDDYTLTVEEPIAVRVQVKSRGAEPFEATVPLRVIKEDKQWVILGNWLVGKYVSSDAILVRSTWQRSSITVPDFYCRLLSCPIEQ